MESISGRTRALPFRHLHSILFAAAAIPAFAAGAAAAQERAVRVPIFSDGRSGPVEWEFTTEDPGEGWAAPGFDAAAWQKGSAGFGNGVSGTATAWTSDDIWMRKSFTADPSDFEGLALDLNLDDSHEIYLNGQLVHQNPSWTAGYRSVVVPNSLQAGANLLAVHCRNTGGSQMADVGLLGIRKYPAQVLIPDFAGGGAQWLYTTVTPPSAWHQPGFDPQGWLTGSAGFGTPNYGARAATLWDTPEIWLRKTFTLPRLYSHYQLLTSADDDITLLVNGQLVLTHGYAPDYADRLIPAEAFPVSVGENVIAVHVANTQGNAFVDLLLAGVDVKGPPTAARKPLRGAPAKRQAVVSLRVDGGGRPLRNPAGTRIVKPDGRAAD